MKALSICIILCFSKLAFSYEIGDTVLYHDSATAMKGKIVEFSANGDEVKLDFGSTITNIYYDNFYSIDNDIEDYKSVRSYTFKRSFWGKPITMNVDDCAIYEDSATTKKGKIVDITENGYGKLDFGNTITNNYYGNYHPISKSIFSCDN